MALVFVPSATMASIPRFAPRELVQSAGVPIDVGAYGSPLMFDWDQDGKKDVLMGTFAPGYIKFYRNVGTDSLPEFNGFEFLFAGGDTIVLPSG